MTNAMAGLQAVSDIITILNGWNVANTDNRSPAIVKRLELENQQQQPNADYVIIDYDTEIITPFGLYASDWRHDIPISIEVKTSGFVAATNTSDSTDRLTHAQNMVNEVARLIKTNARLSGYAMTYIRSSKNNAHQVRNTISIFVDLLLVKINP
jgi:hypothetical protein